MTISIELIVFIGVVLMALIGLIYRNLDAKILSVNTEVAVLKTTATDRDTCLLRTQLNEEKFANINHRMNDVKEQNKEYHEALKGSLSELHKSVESIRECVTKLSAGIDCE